MRRRRSGPASSLDLFLDTICNTFGGIMFLAILLSVLVQMRSKEPKPLEPSTVPMTAAEARAVTNQLDVLTSTHSRLSELLVELRKNQPLPEDQTIQALGKQSKEAQETLDETTRLQMDASKQLAKQIETNAEIVQSMEDFRQRLIAERAAVERVKLALDDAFSDQMEVLKLPKVETSFKSKVFFLMRYRKVYALANTPSAIFDNADLNETDLTIQHVGADAFTAAPKAQQGWTASNVKLDSFLQSCTPTVHVLHVIVWPDSYAEFSLIKQKMIQLGFKYDLQPLEDVAACSFGKGSGASRVQ